MWHFSSSVPAPHSLFILLAQSWPLRLSVCFLSNSPWKQERRENREKSSASPEQRRGTSKYTWYDGILSTNEVHVVVTKTCNFYLYFIFLCEAMPRTVCTKSSCDSTPADTLNQREKRQKELADRLFSVRCWRHRRKKPLLPSTGGTVHEAGPANGQTSAFVPLPSQQASTALC